jgi:hypothetical protein
MGKNNKFAFLSLKRILIILLICTYLLPIWIFRYFPTQDGPSHIYNSQVLREYHNSDYDFKDYYNLNLTPFPNWFSHITLALLMYVFPPLFAEKVFLSIYIVIFPLCIFYFLNSVQRGKDIIGFVSFLFVYNYLFLMGFYNFAISVPLFFLALGYWWKEKENITIKRIVILNLILAVIYFSHLIPYVVSIASISLISILYFRKRIKKILITLCCMIPSSILLFNYLLSSELLSGGTPSLGFSRIHQLLIDLISLKTLVSYNQSQSNIAYLVSALMLCLFVYTLWKDKIAVKGKFFERFTSKDYFLLIYFIILILYFILPGSIGPGGWTNDRLAILASMLILAWFKEFDSIKWKRIFMVFITIFSLVNVAYIGYYCKILNTELDEYTSETGLIEKNKVVLPLFFDGNGKSLKVGIFVNAANYYCLDNGGINLGNYEVQFDYFPVKFKENFQPPFKEKDWVQAVHWRPKDIDFCDYSHNIDYLVIWGKEDETISESVKKCYNLMASNGRLKIYCPKLQEKEK